MDTKTKFWLAIGFLFLFIGGAWTVLTSQEKTLFRGLEPLAETSVVHAKVPRNKTIRINTEAVARENAKRLNKAKHNGR